MFHLCKFGDVVGLVIIILRARERVHTHERVHILLKCVEYVKATLLSLLLHIEIYKIRSRRSIVSLSRTEYRNGSLRLFSVTYRTKKQTTNSGQSLVLILVYPTAISSSWVFPFLYCTSSETRCSFSSTLFWQLLRSNTERQTARPKRPTWSTERKRGPWPATAGGTLLCVWVRIPSSRWPWWAAAPVGPSAVWIESALSLWTYKIEV